MTDVEPAAQEFATDDGTVNATTQFIRPALQTPAG
jgi:hypothetical protein